MLERLISLGLAWERLSVSPNKLEEVAGDSEIQDSLLRLPGPG